MGPLGLLVGVVRRAILPIVQSLRAFLASALGRKAVKALGIASAGTIASFIALQVVLGIAASVLVGLGFGDLSNATASLLVEGVPTTWAATFALAQTIPGVAAGVTGVMSGLFGLRR
jgi:hypothetical protein